METNPTKERLKKRLNKRNEAKGIPTEPQEDQDLLNMISQVQKMLKTNPELVNKVSSCVNNLMGNQELMEKLNKEFEKETTHSQTLDKSKSGDNSDAVSK